MKINIAVFIIIITAFFLTLPDDTVANAGGEAEIILIKEDDLAGESLLYQDIVKLGYNVDVTSPLSVTIDQLRMYRLVVLSTGNYPFACQNSDMRLALQTFITDDLGKVLIEGGNNGYIAAVFPGYLGFKNKVIKIDDWVANDGGSLNISGQHAFSALALEPNILPATLNINYTSINNQDVCTNNEFSELFYGTSLYPDKVGVLVAPVVDNPQVINFFVTYSSFADNSVAIKLLQNSIYNLIGNPVSVSQISEIVPGNYRLYQNYPNPFNPATKIKFDIKVSDASGYTIIKLSVFNSAGKLISVIAEGKYSSGTYEAEFNAENLPGGVYFYRLSSDERSGNNFQTRKMVLIK